MTPRVAVVVPVRNDASTLPDLVSGIVDLLEQRRMSFEIVLVDDASTDSSWASIQQLSRLDPRVSGVRLARRCGQIPATMAGVQRSSAPLIVYIDADLEYDPVDIGLVLDHLEDGADMVSAVRTTDVGRSLRRRLMTAAVRRVAPTVVKTKISDLGSGLKGWRRPVWDAVISRSAFSHGMLVTYVMATTAGRIDNIPIETCPSARRSGYSVTSLVALASELLLMASPGALAGLLIIGVGAVAVGAIAACVTFAFALGGATWATAALLLSCTIALAGGMASCTGVMGLAVRSVLVALDPVYEVAEPSAG